VDEADRLVRGGEIAQVVTADTQRRHLDPGTTQRSPGDIAVAEGVAASVGDVESHPGTEHACGAHELSPGGVPLAVGRGWTVLEDLTVTQRPRTWRLSVIYASQNEVFFRLEGCWSPGVTRALGVRAEVWSRSALDHAAGHSGA